MAQVQQAARGGGKNGQTRSAEWYAAQEAKKKKEKEEKSEFPSCACNLSLDIRKSLTLVPICYSEALEKQMLKLLAEGLF